jgi:cysteine desulfurase
VVINFDANASTFISSAVRDALAVYLEQSSSHTAGLNPSAIHKLGQGARAILENARAQVRSLLSAPRDAAVVFCSGATEAINHAVRLAFPQGRDERSGARADGARVVLSAVEHTAVREAVRALGIAQNDCAEVPVTSQGELLETELLSAIGTDTRLVALMRANNETGVCFPVGTLAELIRARAPDALILCDAVQAVGKIPCSFPGLGADMLVVSGHKVGALSGVGALVLSSRVPPAALIHGGAQESRWRGGTENLLGILSLSVALREAERALDIRCRSMREAQSFAWRYLKSHLPEIELHGPDIADGDARLPNTLNVYVPGCIADDLVVALDLEGVCISSGAACSSGKPEPSHVLRAMGFTDDHVRSSVRISFEPDIDGDALTLGLHLFVQCVQRMRGAHVGH